MNAILIHALQENNLTVSPPAQQQILQFLHLLQSWNKVFNLTNITEPREMIYLHIIDCLLIQPFLYGKHMLDVGTGPGLPGIPLAIINPQQKWVLLDKNSKKTRFLMQVISELDLKNVQIVSLRCENFDTASCFDSILSRAFGTLSLFVESTKHLICEHGKWIAMKGKYPSEELAAIHFPYMASVSRLAMKGMDIERHVVTILREVWEK